jgi:5-methylphenazine-1-carboxylate 1-monooxygenase
VHDGGIAARLFERRPEIRELGGHDAAAYAIREFAALRLRDELMRAGVVIREAVSSADSTSSSMGGTRPARRLPYPEVNIHSGPPHLILYRAALARIGAEASAPTTNASGPSRTTPA